MVQNVEPGEMRGFFGPKEPWPRPGVSHLFKSTEIPGNSGNTDFGHLRSFRLAASPRGLAAGQARRPPQAGGAPKTPPLDLRDLFAPEWYYATFPTPKDLRFIIVRRTDSICGIGRPHFRSTAWPASPGSSFVDRV